MNVYCGVFLNILLILNYFAAWVFAATVAHRYVDTNYKFVGGLCTYLLDFHLFSNSIVLYMLWLESLSTRRFRYSCMLSLNAVPGKT